MGGGWLDWVRFDFYPRPPGGGRPIEHQRLDNPVEFLSTPSGWRATIFMCCANPDENGFLSTPSGWRATRGKACLNVLSGDISIHALRVEGDDTTLVLGRTTADFYPRPPGGGRPGVGEKSDGSYVDFYPRPPGGGRRFTARPLSAMRPFLSTPSGWRATPETPWEDCDEDDVFLSTPSGWRATQFPEYEDLVLLISIHALRVEGDLFVRIDAGIISRFLSTPSGWRATAAVHHSIHGLGISIHALRVEGDAQTRAR